MARSQESINDFTMMKLTRYQDPDIVVSERDVALLQIQAIVAVSLGISDLVDQVTELLKECRSEEK